MSDFDFIEFLFRLKAVEQKERQIAIQERQTSTGYSHNDELRQNQIENSKQTLEVIRLTRDLRILTIILVAIGIFQVWIMLSKP